MWVDLELMRCEVGRSAVDLGPTCFGVGVGVNVGSIQDRSALAFGPIPVPSGGGFGAAEQGFLLRFAAADVRETSAFLEFLFQEFDTDGDGWITAREMKRAAGRVRDDETRDIAAQARARAGEVSSTP